MPKCRICANNQTNFFHRTNNFKYSLCANCQTLFLSPLPSQKKINHYYQKKFQYETGLIEEKRLRQRAKIILKNLIKLNPQGKTLLDIGSGLGFFLEEANKFGLKAIGIEPAKKLATTTINQLIEVKNITFEEYFRNNRYKKFDFIVLIHVIEHLINPQQTLKQAMNLLNKNGLLYIETPNLNSHLFFAEKQNYTFLTPPDHLWIFSKKSLEIIFKDISLAKIVKISTYSYSEHLMGVIKRKFQMVNSKFETNTQRQNNLNNKNKNLKITKSIKYFFLDKILASLFTPLLSIGGYGSILELYVKKD